MSEKNLSPVLKGLQPEAVWRHFYALTQIPRCSGHEEGVRQYVQNFAKERGFVVETDAVGNVLLRVLPDAPGESICVQGHMDMVCVADEAVEHDFAKDPIGLRREDDKLYAIGTSLGADNGIGVAYGLALAESSTGPLEVLCTVDEEVGLVGASSLQPGWLKSKILLNLDSEEEDFITIACSGGRDWHVRLPFEMTARDAGQQLLEIKIGGLQGGHSGIDIDVGRVNALQVMGKMLAPVLEQGGALAMVQGGVKHNAIPSSARAQVSVAAGQQAMLQDLAKTLEQDLRCDADPGLEIVVRKAPQSVDQVLTNDKGLQVLALLQGLPHGVSKHSPKDPTLPFVSNNFAIVAWEEAQLHVTLSGRSPVAKEIDSIEARINSVCEPIGAAVVSENSYPGWEPNYDSPLLAKSQKIFAKYMGKEAKILEIHAGLECGIIGAKYPGMDMISIGPDLHYPHSPREHVIISSVERVFLLVQAIIDDLR